MQPWQANIVGVGVAGLVLGGGLLLSAPEAGANGPTRVQTLGAPHSAGDSAAEIPIGDSIQLLGRPARLGVFWTSDSSEKVAQTYVDAWMDFHVPPRVYKLDKVTSVTALDTTEGPGSGLIRSVTIIDEGDDRMVMPGLSDMSQPIDMTPRKAPVPVPETATAYSGATMDDAGSVSYSASYVVPMNAQRVMDFYEAELGKQSYKVAKARKKIAGGAAIEFQRGPEWLSIVARNEDLDKAAKTPGSEASEVMITHVRTVDQKPEWKP